VDKKRRTIASRRPRDAAEVTANDKAVEAVIDERQQFAEQLDEQLHGIRPRPASDTKTIEQTGQAGSAAG
jgi:hypothetical protein